MNQPALRSPLHTIDAVRLTMPRALTTVPLGFALYPDRMAAPLLCPLLDGSGVLLEDWTDPLAQTFHVPAAQMNDVRLALELSRAE